MEQNEERTFPAISSVGSEGVVEEVAAAVPGEAAVAVNEATTKV